MTIPPVARLDRRHVRRAETIEEIVDVAVQVMAEDGVAGLSLGEVARRVGIKAPSLYVYFPSKNAVYDAVFSRGWRQVGEELSGYGEPEEATDLRAYAGGLAATYVRWSIEHPVYAQLMGWRPVPGYQPSEAAYQPAIDVFERGVATMGRLQQLGLFRTDVSALELLRTWTVLTSGVVSQQLSNAPDETFEEGTFAVMLPVLVDMFLAHFAPGQRPAPPRRGRHAHDR